ncbi:MAG: hypothetical protein R3F14_44425 [Polyangiaceae bacterium]
MSAPTSVRPTPSLRIEELGVQGYRNFKDRVTVPFRAGRRPAEAVSALHGESGAGKSNLLSALAAFFAAADLCLTSPTGTYDVPPPRLALPRPSRRSPRATASASISPPSSTSASPTPASCHSASPSPQAPSLSDTPSPSSPRMTRRPPATRSRPTSSVR